MSFDPESDDASIRFSLMELGDPPKREEHVQAPLARVISTETVTKADHVAGLTHPRNRQIVDLDADPFVPDGWSVEEHRKRGMLDFDPAKISFYLSEQQKGHKSIIGYMLCEELKDQPVLNANPLDWLLREGNQHLIPEEWKSDVICFWGTIYRLQGGDLCVRCLFWHGGGWYWSGYWLGHDWSSDDPAAVSAS